MGQVAGGEPGHVRYGWLFRNRNEAKTFMDVTHPDDIQDNLEVTRKLLSGEVDCIRWEKRYLHKYGQIVWTEQSVTLLKDEVGKPQYFLSLTENITERKEAEIALRESEERYSIVVNNVSDLITIIDPEGNYIYASPSHQKIMGFSPEELVGTNAFGVIHPDDIPHIVDKFQKILKGERSSAHFRVKCKDGHYIPLEGSGKAINDAFMQPYVIVVTSHDLSDSMELKRRKHDLLTLAAHELKTPLTVLKTYVQILEKNGADKKNAGTYTRKTDIEINRVSHLIDKILEVSQWESAAIELDYQKFRLDTLIDEVAQYFKAINPKFKLVIKTKFTLEITGDKARLKDALINILDNSIKFSPDAKVVHISVDQAPKFAFIKIQDFGIGIPKNNQGKIFEPFYQASNARIQSRIGLGLGLFIANEIVKKHRGSIEVDSEEGKGSTFLIRLPLSLKHSTPATASAKNSCPLKQYR